MAGTTSPINRAAQVDPNTEPLKLWQVPAAIAQFDSKWRKDAQRKAVAAAAWQAVYWTQFQDPPGSVAATCYEPACLSGCTRDHR